MSRKSSGLSGEQIADILILLLCTFVFIKVVFPVIEEAHSMEVKTPYVLSKAGVEVNPNEEYLKVEHLQHELTCLKAKVQCDAREDKTFPCISPYGDTLIGNILVENPLSCDEFN